MIQYKKVLNELMHNGYLNPAARKNMPSTLFLHSQDMRFNLLKGFPILTGKEMPFFSITGELIGFMQGKTDVRDFDRLGTKVWWDNAYKWNMIEHYDINEYPRPTMDEYKKGVCKDGAVIGDQYYDLGRIYSAQWRGYRGYIPEKGSIDGFIVKDQLKDMIEGMNTTPYSRYHVMTAWNPAEMNNEYVSQPNCHVYFQASLSPFIVPVDKFTIKKRLSKLLTAETIDYLFDMGYNPNKYLFTHLTQRSCDIFLGVPFNISSYSLFSVLLAIFTNSLPVEFKWTGVNTHLYDNHNDQSREYLKRDLKGLPRLDVRGINSLSDIENIKDSQDIRECFKLEGYNPHPKIKAPLSVGL